MRVVGFGVVAGCAVALTACSSGQAAPAAARRPSSPPAVSSPAVSTPTTPSPGVPTSSPATSTAPSSAPSSPASASPNRASAPVSAAPDSGAPKITQATATTSGGYGAIALVYSEAIDCPAGSAGDFSYVISNSGGHGAGAGELPPPSAISCRGRSALLVFNAVTRIVTPGVLSYTPPAAPSSSDTVQAATAAATPAAPQRVDVS